MSGTKPLISDVALTATVTKTNAHFRRMHERGGKELGVGKFFLLVEITAKKDVYVPVSIASGKKPTGFIYEIVGTAESALSTTDISCEGDTISQITLGTISYCKIPGNTTGTFRIFIETQGKVGGEYNVSINRINYKLDPHAARYEKIAVELVSESVQFG